jgi:hypothetical protein
MEVLMSSSDTLIVFAPLLVLVTVMLCVYLAREILGRE